MVKTTSGRNGKNKCRQREFIVDISHYLHVFAISAASHPAVI